MAEPAILIVPAAAPPAMRRGEAVDARPPAALAQIRCRAEAATGEGDVAPAGNAAPDLTGFSMVGVAG